MIIILKIDDLAFELFPDFKGKEVNDQLLIKTLTDYYTYGPYIPKIKIQSGIITIEINSVEIESQEEDYRKAIKLCESGKFEQAINILIPLVLKNPTNSEYHRVLGQSYSSIGKQDEAIDSLIDSLKWNPNNNYALLMIGNIFGKFKNDLSTAKKYYDRVIENNPNDHIAINNLGTNFLQAGKIKEGLEYLEKAYAVNKDYPNTIYGIALANDMLGNTLLAFEYAIRCIKICKPQDREIKRHCIELVFDTSNKYLMSFSGEKTFLEYKSYIEKLCKRPVKVIIDNNLETAAKMEYAENHEKDYHLIKYNSNKIGIYHLMIHELTHLQFATEAREENANMQFTTNENQKKKFKRDHIKSYETLRKSNIPESSIEKFFNSLYSGINLQLFNTPIDLFIEDQIYDKYQELRPIQFLSIFQMLNESSSGVIDKNIISFTPPVILSANKILNLVMALQFKDLFGFEVMNDFQPSKTELKIANDFFQEYYQYRDDKAPGEEYELIEHWGEDLHLESYFTLRKEPSFDKPMNVDQAFENLIKDPLGIDSNKEFKAEQVDQFLKSQKEIGTNMAVVMYMVDALQYFEKIPKEEIKKIAFEIALHGTQGYKPDKLDYTINSIPGKVFTGYKILAYYYISFAIAIPELLAQLQLPYDAEYNLATTMHRPKENG